MAVELSRISDQHLTDEEAEKGLEAVPIIPRDDTVFKVFNEEEVDRQPEKATRHTMLSEAMKAIFDNLTGIQP